MRRLVNYYLAVMRLAILEQIQYPFSNTIYMLGMIAEPVIYLTVWSKVASIQGGAILGFTPEMFAAYYIIWTLVRNMNLAYTNGWSGRVHQGTLNKELLRPIHPLHYDVAYFAGWKLVIIAQWLPVAFILGRVFKTDLHPSVLQLTVFIISIWGAYILRSLLIALMGSISFWTTRDGAFLDLVFALELVLSGRLAPLALMPGWVQSLSFWLPFRWTFYFPITVLVGNATPAELITGLGIQGVWIVGGILAARSVWLAGIKHYAAVGG